VSGPPEISPKDFAGAFKRFLDQAVELAPAEDPFFLERLRAHFGVDPSTLPVLSHDFPISAQPDLQVAVDAYLASDGRSAELFGIAADQFQAEYGISLSQLVSSSRRGRAALAQGPVEHSQVKLGETEVLSCVQRGLFLIDGKTGRLAVLLSRTRQGMRVEAMAPLAESAEQFVAELRASMREQSVYRARVLSLTHGGAPGQVNIHVHKLPELDRDQIVLPEGLLDRVERHTAGFARHSDALLAAGRHLKRGLLLHGPPGTGKTLTAMYLATLMQDRTVMLLKGRGFGLIESTCAIARTLAPAIVILEDVDLVAEERTRPGAGGCTPLLFELLNEMDGLAEDVDVVFLLTTNRPDILEPALAARPGRVDQAIEIPLPDKECRRQLFELYGRGLTLELNDLDDLIQRTDGASGAFIRELLRKAALLAAEEGGQIVVKDRHLQDAIRELVIDGGDLTKSLLGARVSVGFST
jgi:hypothetical protein